MKKLIFTILISILFSIFLNEKSYSANERFRSINSGDWNATSTWEMSTNSGSTWFAATSTPTDTSGLINIRSLNTVTVTVNVNADQLTVENGGTLTINASIILTLLNGSGDDLTLLPGGIVSGAGKFQTQGTVLMNIRDGSNFNVALNVNTGTDCSGGFDFSFKCQIIW